MAELTAAPLDLLAHAAEVRSLHVAALLTVVEATGIGGTPTDEPHYARHAGRQGFRCVGVRDDGRLVGFAYGVAASAGSWWDAWVRPAMTAAGREHLLADAFEVVAVHVDPARHGEGQGRRLVEALLAGQPYPHALLTTQGGGNPARGFYRRLGFRELPVEVDHDGVPYVVLVADLPLTGATG